MRTEKLIRPVAHPSGPEPSGGVPRLGSRGIVSSSHFLVFNEFLVWRHDPTEFGCIVPQFGWGYTNLPQDITLTNAIAMEGLGYFPPKCLPALFLPFYWLCLRVHHFPSSALHWFICICLFLFVQNQQPSWALLLRFSRIPQCGDFYPTTATPAGMGTTPDWDLGCGRTNYEQSTLSGKGRFFQKPRMISFFSVFSHRPCSPCCPGGFAMGLYQTSGSGGGPGSMIRAGGRGGLVPPTFPI